MRYLVVVVLMGALFCVSCTTWFVNYGDGTGARLRKEWLSCSGRCDSAFETLVTREDTSLALAKLTRALDLVPIYDKSIAAEIHWDRAILWETRGDWLKALQEIDAAVALDGSPMYAEERASLRRRLGVPADAPAPRPRAPDMLGEGDDIAEKCACLPGQSEDPPDEATFVKVIEPGKGIGPIVIDRSRVEDVIRVYGCDCRMTKRRRDNAVTTIDYSFLDAKGGIGTGSHRPDRIPNATRPAFFAFEADHVKRIALNIYQTNLATAEGLKVRGTKADMTRALGDGFRLETSRNYEKYHYRELGIDVWIAHANDKIGAIHIFRY
jgi:hypothetical protein